ncbi:MAG: hypothetical protein ABFD70_13520 [Syntrophaceae bacterium]|nr:hypothetical protein [Deltaproteobacteria bacterium]
MTFPLVTAMEISEEWMIRHRIFEDAVAAAEDKVSSGRLTLMSEMPFYRKLGT